MDRATRHLLRDLAPRVLGVLLRRYRDFSGCEDALQEALLAAASQWPEQGMPENPRAWLTHVASRKVTDQIRAETARRLRERLVVSLVPPEEQIALAADEASKERDDTLSLFFLCCHPSLSPASQIALTLRALGGLSTAEIGRAYLVPEETMAQRLVRAKQTIQRSGIPFRDEEPLDLGRLPSVLSVLYLIFNEGYAASEGEEVYRVDLSEEAIRVTRLLLGLTPEDPEVLGLLALMLLTDARRAARSGPEGSLVPLDRQDRALWDRPAIAEGLSLLTRALAPGRAGPFQIQAAIAALHDEAESFESTDWPQILALYEVLLEVSDSPMARLSRAIALAMVSGPAAGLSALDALAADPRLQDSHRLASARAHLLERSGDSAGAIDCYRRAADRTTSTVERNYLLLQAARLAG